MTPDGFHLNSASSFVDQVQTGPTTATVTVGMVTPSADLSIAKADSADPVLPGNSLTYTVTVSNAGPSAANDVAVTDTLPAGASSPAAAARKTPTACRPAPWGRSPRPARPSTP